MFGYVHYDYPNLFIKDLMLYRALYCGLCKGIASACGQRARLGLSYDVTFLSALLHNIMGVDVVIEQQNCFEHAIKKRPIAKVDDLTRELGALNTVLCYYKLTDDIADGGKGRGRRRIFKKGFLLAKKDYPALVSLVENFMKEQEAAEKARYASPDMAAEPTAQLLAALSDHFLKEKASEKTRMLFYALGKWVYLIDALDDFEKDKKKGGYNPFVLAYKAETREELLKENDGEVGFLFDTIFLDLRENLGGIRFYFNRDLTDNIILRGIPLETRRVMSGKKREPVKVKVP